MSTFFVFSFCKLIPTSEPLGSVWSNSKVFLLFLNFDKKKIRFLDSLQIYIKTNQKINFCWSERNRKASFALEEPGYFSAICSYENYYF